MITPKLESLIWEGRAFFKTYIAGGVERSTLKIDNDRFIIITDITYFSTLPAKADPDFKFNDLGTVYTNGQNTQLTVLGEKGINRFMFRNGYTAVGTKGSTSNDDYRLLPIGSHLINTYLLHTTEVTFTFSFGGNSLATFVGNVPAESEAAYPPPTDYGRVGQPGAVPVVTSRQFPGTAVFENTYINRPAATVDSSKEYSYPVDATTQIDNIFTQSSPGMPYAQVCYIEILGQPNNMQF
jgi:hypothetical protein